MSVMSEAVRQWAWSVGQGRSDQQWLLSDYDTWECNPHYHGPDQRHPEDIDWGEELDFSSFEEWKGAAEKARCAIFQDPPQSDYWLAGNPNHPRGFWDGNSGTFTVFEETSCEQK